MTCGRTPPFDSPRGKVKGSRGRPSIQYPLVGSSPLESPGAGRVGVGQGEALDRETAPSWPYEGCGRDGSCSGDLLTTRALCRRCRDGIDSRQPESFVQVLQPFVDGFSGLPNRGHGLLRLGESAEQALLFAEDFFRESAFVGLGELLAQAGKRRQAPLHRPLRIDGKTSRPNQLPNDSNVVLNLITHAIAPLGYSSGPS